MSGRESPDELMPPPEIGQEADAPPDRAPEVDRPGGDLEQALGVRAAAAARAAAGAATRAGSGTRSTAFVLARLESEGLAPVAGGRADRR